MYAFDMSSFPGIKYQLDHMNKNKFNYIAFGREMLPKAI